MLLRLEGGVAALLPLVAMLDQPVRPSSDDEPIDYCTPPARATAVLSLIADLLRDDEAAAGSLVQMRFALLLGYVLRRISPALLGDAALRAIAVLVDAGATAELRDELCHHVLLDFRIWAFAPVTTQRALIALCAAHLARRPVLAQRFGVRHVLDTIRHIYWHDDRPSSSDIETDHDHHDDVNDDSNNNDDDDDDDDDVASVPQWGTLPRRHPVTKQTTGKRPSRDDVTQLRSLLYGVARQLVGNGLTPPDIATMVSFALECDEPTMLGELLDVCSFTLVLSID
jgi:hypothetical protein